MSAAPVPTPANEPASAPSGGAQWALGLFLAVLLGLLAFRGYGNQFGARPTDPAGPALIDVNIADPAELAQVPGVGPKMAEAIVAHRRANGPFKAVEELKGVRGVGPLTFEKVRHRFRVGDDVPAPAAEVTHTSFASPIAQHPPPAAIPARPVAAGGKKIQPGEPPINVNSASADELQRLPGVGPVMAGAIVAARAARPFESVNDLDRVKGIGPKTLDRLRPFVVVK